MLQFGGENSESDSVAGSREMKANGVSRAGRHHQQHGKALCPDHLQANN